MPAKHPTPRPFRPTPPDPALAAREAKRRPDLKSIGPRDEVLSYLDSDEARAMEFLTNQVHSIFPRISLRMLQWWDENQIISPAFGHHHHRRHYGVMDLIKIGVTDELRFRGFSLWRIRPVMKRLDSRLQSWRRGRMADPIGELLVITAERSYLETGHPMAREYNIEHAYMDTDAGALAYMKQLRGPACVIGTADVARRIVFWIDQTQELREAKKAR
jgi:DNA-binding transcriptional MerR regulator